MKKPNVCKQLTYAYPSSLNAARFGCKDSGCWIVSVSLDWPHKPFVAVAGFQDRDKAMEYASAIVFPWGTLCGKPLIQEDA